MIQSFRHKGLQRFFETGSKAGIRPEHAGRLGDILEYLSRASKIDDLALPGLALHELKGRMRGRWAVRVSGNWRVTFRFTGQDAQDVDYVDYH